MNEVAKKMNRKYLHDTIQKRSCSLSTKNNHQFLSHVKNSSHNDQECEYFYHIWIFTLKRHKSVNDN